MHNNDDSKNLNTRIHLYRCAHGPVPQEMRRSLAIRMDLQYATLKADVVRSMHQYHALLSLEGGGHRERVMLSDSRDLPLTRMSERDVIESPPNYNIKGACHCFEFGEHASLHNASSVNII